MILRKFNCETDFSPIAGWIRSDREHAMWCGGRFSFPLERNDFLSVLEEHRKNTGDLPYMAQDEQGRAVGFFVLSSSPDTGSAMLKFVIVDFAIRGKGVGREMIHLAAELAFQDPRVRTLRLCVFAENPAALRCYQKAGFCLTSTDPNAFHFRGQLWSRCHMALSRPEQDLL